MSLLSIIAKAPKLPNLTVTIISKSKHPKLEATLRTYGYTIGYASGGKYETPKKADLWIALDDAYPLLRWAPKGTKKMAIDRIGNIPMGDYMRVYEGNSFNSYIAKVTSNLRLSQLKTRERPDGHH